MAKKINKAMQHALENTDYPIYYIMSDQPDCCRQCGDRLDLVEIKVMDGERYLFLNV